MKFVTIGCQPNEFNEVMTLTINPVEKVIQILYHSTAKFRVWVLIAYSLIYLILAAINFGASIPSGLFVPHIFIGALYGRFIGTLFRNLLDIPLEGVYAFLGAASMIAGS